jgi:predicted RNase H-like HicB family nuclease
MSEKYTAMAVRDGRWWAVSVPALRGVHTQGRDLDDAQKMAREAAALWLGVDASEVEIELHVEGADDALDEVSAAREAREKAAAAEQATLANAATKLVGLGMSQRDAAQLLGLSHQRVSQLLAGRHDAA